LGSAYVIGITYSRDFPTTAGAFDTILDNGGAIRGDIFVTKLNPSGDLLAYSTFLGGEGGAAQALSGFNNDIAVDALGNAYVCGLVDSSDFPTTPGAFDTTSNSTQDGFVAKLNPTGSALVYSTFLGGIGSNWPLALAIDSSGNAYVAGLTTSAAFPVTPGAFDTTTRGGFEDGFVTKLNPSGSALVYSTFLGGAVDDQVNSIAVDSSGSVYVAGSTESFDFPTTPCAFDQTRGFQDAFVTKLNPAGTALEYSTYLGGNTHIEAALGIAVDASGNAIVVGRTLSGDFPTTPDAFDPTFNGSGDVFITRLSASGRFTTYSTFLGGSSEDHVFDIALDGLGGAYMAGGTASPNFPTTPGAFDITFGGGNSDAFVTKLTLPPVPPVPPEAFVPAAIQLMPMGATNPVGTSHTVIATVENAAGNRLASVIVRFNVTGSTTASGSSLTDANGQTQFTYQGPMVPGSDTITAFADTDANGAAGPCALGCGNEDLEGCWSREHYSQPTGRDHHRRLRGLPHRDSQGRERQSRVGRSRPLHGSGRSRYQRHSCDGREWTSNLLLHWSCLSRRRRHHGACRYRWGRYCGCRRAGGQRNEDMAPARGYAWTDYGRRTCAFGRR
jgi:hypothetical protein